MLQPKNSNFFMFILFVTSLGLAFIIGIVLGFLSIANPEIDLFDIPMWALFLMSQLLVFGVPSGIYLLVKRRNIKEILPLRRLGILNALMLTGMTIAIQPLFMLVNLLSQFFFPNVIADSIANVSQEGGFVLMLAIVAVVPSIFEELGFRGIGFAGYGHVKIRTVAMINGLLFGMIHMNMNQFIYAFALGALFCYFMYYTKSLWAPILAHFVFNGTQSLMMYVALGIDPYALYNYGEIPPLEGAEMVMMIIFMSVLSIAFMVAFIALFIAFKQHNIKRNNREGVVTDTAEAHRMAGGTRPPVFTWSFWVVVGLFVLMMLLNYLVPTFVESLTAVGGL